MFKKFLIPIISIVLGAGGATGYNVLKERKDFDKKACESSVRRVVKVIDGDTIKIKDGVKVRLLGVNAPERGECYFEESGDFLKGLLTGKDVRLEKDISGVDKYERLLRYVVIPSRDPKRDDILVNDSLLRNGYAIFMSGPPNNRYRDLFSSAQEEAKRKNLGLWAECDYETKNARLREKDSGPQDPDCVVKGNISEKGYGKIYLLPGCDNYNRVKIDVRKGEQYFCSEEEAREAGFRKTTNCP